MDSIKADHGFNMDSRSVRNLLQTMSELGVQQRRDFLQFVTGSPKLPIGGKKYLTVSPCSEYGLTLVFSPHRLQKSDTYIHCCLSPKRTAIHPR